MGGRPRRRKAEEGSAPHVVVLAGPNGAGKSSSAPTLLRESLAVQEFVNADTIAAGLSSFRAETVGLEAGRLMLRRLRELASRRVDFAFEVTLASRTFAPWIRDLRKEGYRVSVVFLWLPSTTLAVQRVRARVRMGGHDVPAGVVRRRYGRGLRNFLSLYRPLADHWRVLDNSRAGSPRLIAAGSRGKVEVVEDAERWQAITKAGEAKP